MNIEFSQHAEWDGDRESVLLTATVDGKRVGCVVPQEYLTLPYVEKLNREKALKLFSDQRSSIESKLRQRIQAGIFEPDGKVILPAQ